MQVNPLQRASVAEAAAWHQVLAASTAHDLPEVPPPAPGQIHAQLTQPALDSRRLAWLATGADGVPAAAGAGLRVMASAPLHGGELPGMVDQEPADLIRPGLTPAQACVLSVASCPGVTDVLLAASGAPHWREAADAVAQPSLTAAKLREITGVLASP
ncbi:hypothetical protein [Streptomyces avermitilis]|uniref:hypothetical protein n=1 Tax=Streptomyces avermitilis TaxID=33903 RepID=UPI00371007CA